MAPPQVNQLHDVISCHAWNADRTKVALCPNDTTVVIYKKQGNELVQEQVLKEHDQLVTGIDWAPQSNRIVSCGQDRNAYVWKFENGIWKPTLVILRINRAATDVKWSPNEDKFAVASGAKCVSVCYFEEDNDWWVSKHIKKHNSTVLKVAWHPNNVLLATGSSDGFARVLSGFVKGVDKRPGETPFGSRLPFGELLAEYPAGGWVHSIKWAPAGMQLAFCAHNSTVTVIDVSSGADNANVSVVRLNDLPLLDLVWMGPGMIVGAGHNCHPRCIGRQDGVWAPGRNLDAKEGTQKKQVSQTRAAFNMFKSKVETGNTGAKSTALSTIHQNSINCVQSAGQGAVSTSGLDGKVIVWTL